MKKILIICFCLSGLLGKSQDSTIVSKPASKPATGYRYIIKFSPIEFLFSKFQMAFEHNTGPNGSFQISGAVSYIDKTTKYKEGYSGELQFRSYVLGRQADNHGALNNLYLGPFLNFKHFVIKDYQTSYDYIYGTQINTTTRDNFNAFGIGLITGLNSIIAKRFHFDLFIGGGLRISDSKHNDTNISQDGYKGIAPRFGFDVGVNF